MSKAQRHLLFLAVIVCTLAFSTKGVAAGQPRVRDVWYVYVADDQQYGWAHVTVSRQDDGAFCYEVETRALMDLLGQRQEITEKAKYVVTAEYAPVSLEVDGKSLSGPTRLQGRVDGDRLVLDYQSAGLRRTASIDQSAKAMFLACLDDWLSGQPAGTAKATCRVINESSLKLEPAVATRGPGHSTVWSVDLGLELGQRQLTFDAEGISRESEYRGRGVRLQRSTAEVARKIQHRKMQGREILMFPVDKPIIAPDRLTSLTARLTWKGIPFEQFQLEDERQQIVSRSEENGCYQAVLRIRPATAVTSDLRHPVQSPQYRPWLAETRYIKPGDPDIVRQARQWIGDEKTALGAVRALSSAVFKHMQGGSMIAVTLSAPEVLQSKQGKCSEYAVLFASLARSVGIPTRIVLGMRLVYGCWVGHMWNEAYVGRWITVDAQVDEVGGGPTLLKLVHSDSVLETASIRFGLTDSLEVTVEAFDPPNPAVVGGYKTGIEGPVYTNVECACRLTAPEKTWSLKDDTRKQATLSALGFKPPPVIRFQIPNRDDIFIHFVPMSGLPSTLAPAMLVEARAARFKTLYKGYEVLKNADYPLQRTTGRIFVFRRNGAAKEAATMKTTEVLWNDGTSCFVLNLIADEKSHDEYAAQFFKLLGSFATLPKAPAQTGATPATPTTRPPQQK